MEESENRSLIRCEATGQKGKIIGGAHYTCDEARMRAFNDCFRKAIFQPNLCAITACWTVSGPTVLCDIRTPRRTFGITSSD